MAGSINTNIMVIAVLLGISIVGSKASNKLGIPSILIFIIVGIAAKPFIGEEYTEHKEGATHIAKFLGIIALSFILFSGGLASQKKHIYPIWRSGLILSLLGTLITALCTGCALFWCASLFGLSLDIKKSILVGAILSSTDAAAVFSILRSHKMKLKANIGPLLELESGSNDVMVYFLMIFILRLIKSEASSLLTAIPFFILEMTIGTLGGFLAGFALGFIINKVNLPHQSLYAPLTIALIFFFYSMVNLLHGSGYLAVYLAGIVLGNRDFIHRKSIITFYEGFGWLLEIAMFITLGLLVDMNTLIHIAPLGLLISVVLMFIVRPFSVFSTLPFSSFNAKQKLFISWVGLRGAVPIVFATYLYSGGHIPTLLADQLFHLIFFVVLISVLVQGSTLNPLANRFNLNIKQKKKHNYQKHILAADEDVKKMLIQLEIPTGSHAHKKPVVDLGLPEQTFIALIYRNKSYFPARGSTVLHAHDKLFLVINTKKELKAIKTCLGMA